MNLTNPKKSEVPKGTPAANVQTQVSHSDTSDTKESIIDSKDDLGQTADQSAQSNSIKQLQKKADNYSSLQVVQAAQNKTGLPDSLKTGMEQLSGFSLDDVKVHYNSNQPHQLNAHAYAQGSQIHVAPGQEKHLPHEAWHVVQQKQGRVKPTRQLQGGLNINDNTALEKEADHMGAKALGTSVTQAKSFSAANTETDLIQLAIRKDNVFQLTVYKYASEGPDFHKTDPEKYSAAMGDGLEAKSLHQYKPGEIDLSISTSPMTIFIHGGTLAKFTAQKFYDYLASHNYKPKPDSDIVFITCSGAEQMDEYLVSKGQALANLLGASVHLAKGTVKIDNDGIPYVLKKNKAGVYPRIKSRDELVQIISGKSSGWKSYKPQGITYQVIRDAIRKGFSELNKYDEMNICKEDVAYYKDSFLEILDELRHDRRYIEERYESVEGISEIMKEKFQPRLDFYLVLQDHIKYMNSLLAQTKKHKARVNDLIHEYSGWKDSVADGKGDLEGFKLLFADKLIDWIEPLKLQLAQEKQQQEVLDQQAADKAWGIDDDNWLDDALAEHESPKDTKSSKKAGSTTGKETVSMKKKDDKALINVNSRSDVVQAVMISPGDELANGKELSHYIDHLDDISLTYGSELNLRISFGDPGGKNYGVTHVLMDNKKVIAHEAIVPENIKRHFEVEIILSDAIFDSGRKKEAIPQLVETLTHEWQLHGRQHTLNIIRLKRKTQLPDVHIDHGAHFEDGITDMDKVIAGMASDPENKDIADQLLADYIDDAESHEGFIKRGWVDGDNANAVALQDILHKLKSSWNILKGIKPKAPQQDYEAIWVELFSEMDDDYFSKKASNEEATAAYIAFNLDNDQKFYSNLIRLLGTPIPSIDEHDVYAGAREQLKAEIKPILLYFPGFMDAKKVDENADSKPRRAAIGKLMKK